MQMHQNCLMRTQLRRNIEKLAQIRYSDTDCEADPVVILETDNGCQGS